MQFLDSSAFVEMFLDEPASATLRDFLQNYAEDTLAISSLAQVEARSAIHRRFRNREVSLDALRTALSDLDEVGSLWVRIAMDDRVIHLASGVISRHALRSLDALQLASALALREEVEVDTGLLFIACDQRLLAAAAAEGLAIWNPELSATPASLL